MLWEWLQRCVILFRHSRSYSSLGQLETSLSNKLLNSPDELSDSDLIRQECRRNMIDYYLARCTLVSEEVALAPVAELVAGDRQGQRDIGSNIDGNSSK